MHLDSVDCRRRGTRPRSAGRVAVGAAAVSGRPSGVAPAAGRQRQRCAHAARQASPRSRRRGHAHDASQRGAKRQPAERMVAAPARVPGIGRQARRRAGRRRAARASRRAGVGVRADGAKKSRARAYLDDLPGVASTPTRSAMRGHDAEVVGDQQQAPCRCSRCRSRSRSRICAWMVTSSAVVGSSAISSSGSQASAMAIIDALASWPPESWNG